MRGKNRTININTRCWPSPSDPAQSLPGIPCPLGLKDLLALISSVIKMGTEPGLALIPVGHVDHVQSASKRDTGQRTVPMHFVKRRH